MDLAFHIQHFSFGDRQLQLCVPDENAVKEKYLLEQQQGLAPVFPYWAKLWPASVALCHYLQSNRQLLKGKIVVELAAGLGLPSVYAAAYASKVTCSDYQPEALDIIRQSVEVNHLQNVEVQLVDWRMYPASLEADIVLLSDINYEPGQFEILLKLIKSLLNKGTIVILSTPQRIMGKPFIEALLPFCKRKQTGRVETAGDHTEIFIMQLERIM